MLVGKDVIGFGIEQLSMFYVDFDRFIDKKGIDNVIDTWYNMFKSIDYDYDLAEQDFKQAINELIRFNNKAPSFSDILDGMRELKKQHDLQETYKKLEKI